MELFGSVWLDEEWRG